MPQALLESAMRHVDHLDRLNFDQFKVSVKASDVFPGGRVLSSAGKEIDQPLHLGITEAGGLRSGSVKSAIGPGLLLGRDRRHPARFAGGRSGRRDQSWLRHSEITAYPRPWINFIACPTCSRQEFDVIGTVNARSNVLKTSSPQWTSPSSVVW